MAEATENAKEFARLLNEKFGPNNINNEYLGVLSGRKFDKIAWMNENGTGRSVFAFVERETGDLYKPAGWRVPAKHVRYKGEELLTRAVEDADRYGGFLYMGR